MGRQSKAAEDRRQSKAAEDRRRSSEEEERKCFMYRIKEMEEDMEMGILTKEMPRPNIVKYHDLLGKLWGWYKLLPMGDYVSWSDYSNYLKEYHCRNGHIISSIAALPQTCLNSEEQLVSEWRIKMKSENLMMRKSIVLSCLIHKHVDSIIHTGCILSDVSSAALLCIAKEADLVCQFLRCGDDTVDDNLIDRSREIRTCALALMNCTSDNSATASAVLLGMAREAEMMCAWMIKNNKPIDFCDFVPREIVDSHIVRFETLNVMINILEESCSAAAAAAWHKIDKEGPASRNGPGGDGDGVIADGAANTIGGGISDVLNSHYNKKIKGGEKGKNSKMIKDLMEKLWGWERLLPLSVSVKSADYRSYLEEYFKHNASEFAAGAPANQSPEDSQIANNSYMGADLVKSCLKMEDELLSEWKTRVRCSINDTLSVSTIIQCNLIKELVLSSCSTGGELFSLALLCITKEADLMCELLKHGAEPFDDIIQQSSVIRMCVLGLANLKGHQSISVAAAMVGMTYEAKKMCDWIKREKKLLTFSLSEPNGLECCLIRIKALGVMTSILEDCSFPCI
ncbi:uncharacterized protein LOC124655444 isoform X2 [Lolium rigidum]|uniref:uncharacterized protein LOC124655444 isoform X2 n=1 Tax=Lolium rigidum TaxID=89674 RepID=UPI001F5DEB93|nr:uncharacterized protein LOC124655444 isoform X2 [Lolium rigidum]